MATAFVFETDTMSASEYDDLMAAMGLADPDGPYPDGLLAHLAGAKPDRGWRVIDVWESDDQAEAFYGSDRFAPVRDHAGDRTISPTRWPMHRLGTTAAARARA
ncbi:MAG: hypothetical protein QOE59_524 [Actinomycetota bacterium]|nr:hypothetical protein [Actinomycetota bacterium]